MAGRGSAETRGAPMIVESDHKHAGFMGDYLF